MRGATNLLWEWVFYHWMKRGTPWSMIAIYASSWSRYCHRPRYGLALLTVNVPLESKAQMREWEKHVYGVQGGSKKNKCFARKG